MIVGKFHDVVGHKIFACCDSELVGKDISSQDLVIQIKPSFYGTKVLLEKDILDYINLCDSANFFGKKVCDFLIKKKIIFKEQVIYIANVPHVQIYKL